MTFELLIKLSSLLVGFIVVGSLLCLPLFKWKLSALLTSSLFTKIIWWGPIFIGLLAVLYGGVVFAMAVTSIIIAVALFEFIRARGHTSTVASIYMTVFALSTLHISLWFLIFPYNVAVPLFASVALISILSDVCAFFFGNYLGVHTLPKWLNERKSWEGVLGQIIGALIGGCFAIFFLGISISWLFVFIIGLASAFGDLFNSAAKRSLAIKDWGATIPGHGGFLDRLSSLSIALAISFWFLVFTL